MTIQDYLCSFKSQVCDLNAKLKCFYVSCYCIKPELCETKLRINLFVVNKKGQFLVAKLGVINDLKFGERGEMQKFKSHL